MIFTFNYVKLTIWLSLYYLTGYETIFDIIVYNIKKSGPVLIKFCQWSIPKVKEMYNIDQKKVHKIEDLYEKCNFHSMKYTENIYQQEFNESIHDRYHSIEEVASGSIGQVYKMINKEGESIALKIIHPNIKYEIIFFQFIFFCINKIRPIKNMIQYYFPINLTAFLNDFNSQTNLINEANNNLLFTKLYEGNEYIIIPELIRISRNILIMEYEEGDTFIKENYSKYIVNKIIILYKLFTKNNEMIHNFQHGDLHKGNWKIRKNKSEIKLIIYDFGFCWRAPPYLFENITFLNNTFYNVCIKSKQICDINIDDLVKLAYIFYQNRYDKEILKGEIIELLKYEDVLSISSNFFIKLCLNISRRFNESINSTIINCLILQCQFDDIYTIKGVEDNALYLTYSYLSNMINICETYNIFTELKYLLIKDLNILKKEDRLNYTDNKFSENKTLRKLCLN